MNPLWYATRATGEVAFLLLTIVSVLAGACAAATVLAIAWRLITAPPEHTRTRLVLAAAGLVAITGVVAWTVAGPPAPGWAGRAGTPAKLLGGSAGPVDGAR